MGNEGTLTPYTAAAVHHYVGARIRQCRLEQARSLQDLATQLNWRPEELEAFELGEVRITATRLEELAKALDVPLSFFFAELEKRIDAAPPHGSQKEPHRRALLQGPLFLAVAYYLGAQAAFLLGTLSDRIFTPFWPPNVILFCTLLIVPHRHWWRYVAAVLPAHVLAELQVGMPAIEIAVAFATNCLVAVLNAVAVRHLLGGPPWFGNFHKAIVYVVVTALVGPAVAALGGAFVRISGGAALESYGLFWAQWYLANALASLTLGPALLTWSEWKAEFSGSGARWRAAEAALTAICLGLTSLAAAHATTLTAQQGLLPALMYLPLPVAIWAAVRFGAKGASGAVLIVTALTIWPALNGMGMFVGADAEHNVLDLQLFLIAMSLPLLLLAASVDGARASEHLARQLARALLAAQDDARRRIGRDLHQSIAQTLVEAAECAEEAQRVAPQASGILRHLKQLVLQSNRKVREVSHFLHPPLLDEAGLETALAQYVDDYSDRNRVKVRLEVSPNIGRLSADVELALFRLVEEALETVRKQSQDPSLLVKIGLETTSADREVLLTVESVSADGAAAGPPPLFSLKTPMGRTHSMAIASMRERLSRVGGLVRLDSAAGRVVVRATVPVTGGT